MNPCSGCRCLFNLFINMLHKTAVNQNMVHSFKFLRYNLDQLPRYQCSECDKKFATKVYLKTHFEFFHLKLSKFKCQVCDTLLMTKWKLKNHMQLYHGLERHRDHACADCGKKFFTSATLKSHQLTHSSARLFMCAVCGDTFKQRPSLYTHVRRTHSHQKT